MLRAAAYLLGALVVTVVVHMYLHRRLVIDAALSPRWQRRARITGLGLAALLPVGMAGLLVMREAPRYVEAPLTAFGFGWVGVLMFLLPLLLLSEPARLLPRSPERRRALARIIAGASGIATLGLSGAALAMARLEPVVRRVRIPLVKRDYRLVQISDLHVSATTPMGFVEGIVEAVNALEPDAVAITGDLVDGSVKELGRLVASLSKLRTRDGVYFVTGNHEYLSDAEPWLAFLPSLGVRVLRNEHVRIGELDLVGIDDQAGDPNLPLAVAGRDGARPSVLLAHRPDDVRLAEEHGIDLQISGHTHGGQVPLLWLVERAHQPYVYGLYDVGKTKLHVTSGTGTWGPPMRLGTRSEIVLFELGA